MPIASKREDVELWLRPSWFVALVCVVGFVFFCSVLVSLTGVLQWWQAAIMGGAAVLLVLALLWTVEQMRHAG
jgi:hypothetical protein